MSGNPDQERVAPKPYLIRRDAEGQVRLAVRETRYNGQGFPIVTTTEVEQVFATPNAARAYAKEEFGAETGQFATK